MDMHELKITPEEARAAIVEEMDALRSMLLEKNRRYGNSALQPLRIFSRVDADAQIRVRADDKLKRIQQAEPGDDEDAIMDLIGYLVLLRSRERAVRNLSGESKPRMDANGREGEGEGNRDEGIGTGPRTLEGVWAGTSYRVVDSEWIR